MTDERPCVLVIMGVTEDGPKELAAIQDGERESEQSRMEILLDIKRRGLSDAPKLAVGDGALGFWCTLAKVFPATRQQRCWVHKTANVLNRLPKGQQVRAKEMLHQIWLSSTREEAFKAFDLFVQTYQANYPSRMRHLATFGGQTHRMARAVEKLRVNFDKPLRIESVARELGMSLSGFHAHFKAVTNLSPLQYQKHLRLQEARRLMFSENLETPARRATASAMRISRISAASTNDISATRRCVMSNDSANWPVPAIEQAAPHSQPRRQGKVLTVSPPLR